jgi:hypothetical protein
MNSDVLNSDNYTLRMQLLEELKLLLDIDIHGVSVDPEDFDSFDDTTIKNISLSNGTNSVPFVFSDRVINYSATSEWGLRISPDSIYSLVPENRKPVIYRFGRVPSRVGEIRLKPPVLQDVLKKTTADGVPFHTIANLRHDRMVHVNYSQECVLKDKGEDCHFCNYSIRNATVKNPRQVGEVFSDLYSSGEGKHLNLTSGFMHERRELEYYLDVADEIRERTGLREFPATAVIGAPTDLNVIEKYREAGYFSLRMNIEIWNHNIWKAICPGKDKYCGGWDNWVKALEFAAKVFGKARVASNIVGGIESKKSILEGIEWKLSHGIIGSASVWRPVKGSVLENHRSPETSWHFDLQKSIARLYKQFGYSFAELHNVTPSAGLAVSIFQIENEELVNGKPQSWRY